jgi:DNA-binding transcriptional ArsR family regulator
MARSKKHLYPPEDQVISEAAKSLFHPARMAIIRYLKTSGTRRVSEIAIGHKVSKETLSDHLNILYRLELVTYKERYPYSYYTLHHENTEKALAAIAAFCRHIIELGKRED